MNKKLRNQSKQKLKMRSEMEQFFLTMIQETQDNIKLRKQLQNKEKLLLTAAQLRELTLPIHLRSNTVFNKTDNCK